MIQKTFGNGVEIQFETTEVRDITEPENLRFTDELHMQNGDIWLVTRANCNEIELMLKTRKTIKKSDIASFLQGMSFLRRADCFDLAG